MPRSDPAQLYDAYADGHGGVRLHPKPAFARSLRNVQFRDAATRLDLPPQDQAVLARIRDGAMRRGAHERDEKVHERDEKVFGSTSVGSNSGVRIRRGDADDPDIAEAEPATSRVIAELPYPGPDQHYEVENRGEVCVVILAPGPALGPFDIPEESVGDRRIHRLSFRNGVDPLLRRMNRDAKKFWRDKATGADEQPKTLFVHYPLPDERLELQGPDERGAYRLILITSTSDLSGRTPLGGSGDGPEINSGSSRPERTGDRRTTQQRLAGMNRTNRAYWSRRS